MLLKGCQTQQSTYYNLYNGWDVLHCTSGNHRRTNICASKVKVADQITNGSFFHKKGPCMILDWKLLFDETFAITIQQVKVCVCVGIYTRYVVMLNFMHERCQVSAHTDSHTHSAWYIVFVYFYHQTMNFLCCVCDRAKTNFSPYAIFIKQQQRQQQQTRVTMMKRLKLFLPNEFN